MPAPEELRPPKPLLFGNPEGIARGPGTSALERCIGDSLIALWSRLGRPPSSAASRIQVEILRTIPRAILDDLASRGMGIANTRVLDLGAGLGGLSQEINERGGLAFSVEPDSEWREIVRERVSQGGVARVVGAVGEQLPFQDASFDLVISLQVLEHVSNPEAVFSEVFRVLRPNGHFVLTCDNYLTFREPHYDITWFPLLPKALGCWYLRLRGRSPDFLKQGITYITPFTVLRCWRRAGFASDGEEIIYRRLVEPVHFGWKWRIASSLKSLVDIRNLVRPIVFLKTAKSMFKPGIGVTLRKPA